MRQTHIDPGTSDEARRDLSDLTPRYVPDRFLTPTGWAGVAQYVYTPARARMDGGVIRQGYGLLECVLTPTGGARRARYFGVLGAWINSELRMVVVGVNPRDEVRVAWEVCTIE